MGQLKATASLVPGNSPAKANIYRLVWVNLGAGLDLVTKGFFFFLLSLFNNALSTENIYSFGLKVLPLHHLKMHGNKR
jgi:hypothetical protein